LFHEFDCHTAIQKLYDRSLPLPELLFLDWYMPKMDGPNCLKKIRNILSCTNIPIILITGSTCPAILETAYQFDISLILYESWNVAELTKALEKVISEYELKQ
jgi:CheY-like chemotaxis protein